MIRVITRIASAHVIFARGRPTLSWPSIPCGGNSRIPCIKGSSGSITGDQRFHRHGECSSCIYLVDVYSLFSRQKKKDGQYFFYFHHKTLHRSSPPLSGFQVIVNNVILLLSCVCKCVRARAI